MSKQKHAQKRGDACLPELMGTQPNLRSQQILREWQKKHHTLDEKATLVLQTKDPDGLKAMLEETSTLEAMGLELGKFPDGLQAAVILGSSHVTSIARKTTPEQTKRLLNDGLPATFTAMHDGGIPVDPRALDKLESLSAKAEGKVYELVRLGLPTTLDSLKSSGVVVDSGTLGWLDRLSENTGTVGVVGMLSYGIPAAVKILAEMKTPANEKTVERTWSKLNEVAENSSTGYTDVIMYNGLPNVLETLKKSGTKVDLNTVGQVWGNLTSMAEKRDAEYVYTMMLGGLPRTLDAIVESGVKVDVNTLGWLQTLVAKTKPDNVGPIMVYGLPRALKALRESGVKVDLGTVEQAWSRLNAIAEKGRPDVVEVAMGDALKASLESLQANGMNVTLDKVSDAGEVAVGFVNSMAEERYAKHVLEYVNSKPPRERLNLLEFYSKPLPETEIERVRALPVHVYAYENASLNALRGLMTSTGLRNVTLGYGGEVSAEEAKAKTSDLKINSIISGEGSNEAAFCIQFQDEPKQSLGELGYQPFKYGLKTVSEKDKKEFRRSLNVTPEDKIVVVGSPTEDELKMFADAYATIPKEKRPVAIIAPRYRSQDIKAQTLLDSMSIDYRMRADETGASRVIVLNTTGELVKAYAIADRVFIGSDNNILEPASQGKYPRYFEGGWVYSKMACDVLKKHDATEAVNSNEEIIAVLKDIRRPEDAARRERALQACDEMTDEIIPRYAEAVLKLIHMWGMKTGRL